MMRCFIFIIIIIISLNIKAQTRNDTELILDKIVINLDRLESDFLIKLNRRDYNRASVLIDNIHSLLKSLREPEIFAMEEKSFREFKEAIKNESFSSNRLDLIKTAAASNYFTVQQVADISEVLVYSDERIRAIEIMFPWVIDKSNSFQIFSVLKFSSEKEEVMKIVERYK